MGCKARARFSTSGRIKNFLRRDKMLFAATCFLAQSLGHLAKGLSQLTKTLSQLAKAFSQRIHRGEKGFPTARSGFSFRTSGKNEGRV
ncbi:MAG: hypothetical protein UHL07_00625 [Bacteroidaceae bacterium]|nr:hypothetical protein [Bacteroidaceae bacterium]